MELVFKVRVSCQGIHCGSLSSVVVDPFTGAVTHLVVHENREYFGTVLVPFAWVEQSDSERISLICTPAELAHCPAFMEFELLYGIPVTGYATGTIPSSPVEVPVIEHRRVPEGKCELSKGARVRCVDGPAGRLAALQVRAGDGRITALLVQAGPFWGHRQLLVLASLVDRLSDQKITLRIERQALEDLSHGSLS